MSNEQFEDDEQRDLITKLTRQAGETWLQAGYRYIKAYDNSNSAASNGLREELFQLYQTFKDDKISPEGSVKKALKFLSREYDLDFTGAPETLRDAEPNFDTFDTEDRFGPVPPRSK